MKELPPPPVNFLGPDKTVSEINEIDVKILKFKFYILRTTPPPPNWNFEDCQICVGFFGVFFF